MAHQSRTSSRELRSNFQKEKQLDIIYFDIYSKMIYIFVKSTVISHPLS